MAVIGSSDLDVLPIALGTNTFGWTADRDESFEILDAFVAGGGSLVDTADSYSAWAPGNSGGESETIIGEWIASRGGREQLVLATKVSSHPQFKGLERREHRRGGAGVAAAAADRPHRSLLRALRRSRHAAGGDDYGVRRAGRPRRGALRRTLQLHGRADRRVDRDRAASRCGRAGGAAAALQPAAPRAVRVRAAAAGRSSTSSGCCRTSGWRRDS